jgi:hypothetical protein
LLGTPVVGWIAGGFLVPLVGCVLPALLRPDATALLYGVPSGRQPGTDLWTTLGHTREWLAGRPQPSFGNPYPPLAKVFFAPLVPLSASEAYLVMSALTVLGFVVVAVWYPRRAAPRRGWSVSSVLCVTTGVLSYGLRFELERGQFDLVATACALAAVVLFHRVPRRRWGAYLLLSAAVQLKLYPAIFAVALVDRDDDLRRAGARIAALGAANLLLLGALGLRPLGVFVDCLTGLVNRFEISQFNQSLHAFAFGNAGRLERWGVPALPEHPSLLVWALLAVVGACLLDGLAAARERREGQVPVVLVLGCTVAALVLPPVSYNYRLCILVGPFAAFLRRVEGEDGGRRVSAPVGLWVAGIVALYALTLLPPDLRPAMENALPPLLGLLVGVTLLGRVTRWRGRPADSGRGPGRR